MNLISETLHYIGKNYNDILVVQIGAMDGISFDDTRGHLDLYNWKCLLVEPIPDLYNELKENFKDRSNYTFEQAAITDYDGSATMLTVPSNAIVEQNLHPGYKGMSALYPLKNGFGTTYKRDIDVKANFGKDVEVPCMTLNTLFKKHNISSFDILICDAEGYDWEIFKQLDLQEYRPNFIRLEYVNLTEEEKVLTKNKLETNGYIVQIGQNIDAVYKFLWKKIKDTQELLEVALPTSTTISDLTIVTGLWNINREGRPFEHYIDNFKKFLNIPQNLFIYIPKEYEYLVWEKRSSHNTSVRLYELEDIKNMYAPHWDKTQEIRTNPDWYNLTGEVGWLKNSPQATLEWYNPIVMSKMFLLHDVSIWNPFNTEKFIWLDAGITNTVYDKYFTENDVLNKISPHLDTFLFLSYPYETNDEIHGFKKGPIDLITQANVNYVCRGGLFGGTKEFIHEANSEYYSLLRQTLDQGLMGTEESIFTIMSYLKPEVYRRYELDGNGLIVKFIQDLINDKVELVPVDDKPKIKIYNPSLKNIKSSLYMLTFNFPQQIEHTLATWEANSPDWLSKPRKILIDNSNKPEAIEGNKAVCEKYGFEHIITNENLGINKGRLLAAEHFQESDSDFYFFFEDDMGLNPSTDNDFCRNGFRKFVPDLYNKVHKIMLKENFDFLKLSFTEVYMDNNIQVSWYNVPQDIRTRDWPNYDKLPITGLDLNAPRTLFKEIDTLNNLSYASGEIYYANWPMIVNKVGNQKMFLDTKWARPYEQTWMSYIYQETKKGNINPAILLASPVWHNRIMYYEDHERREN
jgi:FkbM family methyltransferase